MRSLILILMVVPFVVFPAFEELEIKANAVCSATEAHTCKSLWMQCQTGSAPYELPTLTNHYARPFCREQYAKVCGMCGQPVFQDPPLSYWARFQLYGPWWLRFLPGGSSWWNAKK